MNEALAVILTALGSGILTGFINVAIVARSRGKFEGEVTQRLNDHDNRLEGVERSRGEQWEKLNQHGERLSYVEAKVNGKSNGAAGGAR